jgi:hypothetical protein
MLVVTDTVPEVPVNDLAVPEHPESFSVDVFAVAVVVPVRVVQDDVRTAAPATPTGAATAIREADPASAAPIMRLVRRCRRIESPLGSVGEVARLHPLFHFL